MDCIQHSILVFIVNELIAEDPLAFMSPQAHHEQLRLESLHIFAGHDRFDFNLKHSFEGTSQFTHVEKIMELSWGW